MNVVPLATTDVAGALEIVERLRASIESGECVGFLAVGIMPDDSTRNWQATTQRVSRLRMIGAVTNLLDVLQHEPGFFA